MDDRQLATYYAGGRLGIGLALTLFPGLVVRLLLGEANAGLPAVKLLARLVGARDAIIGAGSLAALQGDGDARPGPWMTYGAAADAADAIGILLAFPSLPPAKRFLGLLIAAGGAVTGGYLASSLPD